MSNGAPQPEEEPQCWQKSSFSVQGDCVEVAEAKDRYVLMRDSKNPAGGVLHLAPGEFSALIMGIKAGEFDSLLAPLN